LLLDTQSRTRPFLELGRVPSPIQRKPRPTDFVKDKPHALRLNKKLEEFSLEIFV